MPGSFDEESTGFQLWINLKSDTKMCEPQYQEYTKDKIPTEVKDGVTVKVIAGESLGVNAISYFRVKMLIFMGLGERTNRGENTCILSGCLSGQVNLLLSQDSQRMELHDLLVRGNMFGWRNETDGEER